MAEKPASHTEPDPPAPLASGQTVPLDLGSLYRFDPSQLALDLIGTHYSNHAMVQFLGRDVYIDFLAIPGIQKEGKHYVQGMRIQLSHQAALQLMKTLQQVIEAAERNTSIERFPLVRDKVAP
jgi:hypothetical protein